METGENTSIEEELIKNSFEWDAVKILDIMDYTNLSFLEKKKFMTLAEDLISDLYVKISTPPPDK